MEPTSQAETLYIVPVAGRERGKLQYSFSGNLLSELVGVVPNDWYQDWTEKLNKAIGEARRLARKGCGLRKGGAMRDLKLRLNKLATKATRASRAKRPTGGVGSTTSAVFRLRSLGDVPGRVRNVAATGRSAPRPAMTAWGDTEQSSGKRQRKKKKGRAAPAEAPPLEGDDVFAFQVDLRTQLATKSSAVDKLEKLARAGLVSDEEYGSVRDLLEAQEHEEPPQGDRIKSQPGAHQRQSAGTTHAGTSHPLAVAELEKVFREIDGDNNGTIEREEFSLLAKAAGLEQILTSKELADAFDEMDADGDDEVDFNEFAAFVRKKRTNKAAKKTRNVLRGWFTNKIQDNTAERENRVRVTRAKLAANESKNRKKADKKAAEQRQAMLGKQKSSFRLKGVDTSKAYGNISCSHCGANAAGADTVLRRNGRHYCSGECYTADAHNAALDSNTLTYTRTVVDNNGR